MKGKIFLAGLILFLFFLTGCGMFLEYTLIVEVVGLGTGTVHISPNQESYEEGTTVTLTAVPQTGSFFSEWQGDLQGRTNPVTITMNRDMQIRAVFEEGGDFAFYYEDLSSGSGEVVLNNYGADKRAYVILYPTDDRGLNQNIQSLSTGQAGTGYTPPVSMTPPLLSHPYLLPDVPFLWEKEEEILQNHFWAREQPARLTAQYDPAIGSQEQFQVILQGETQELVTAVLMDKGSNYLLWVEESQNMSSAMAQEIGGIYAATIQPRVTEYFGAEPRSETFPILQEAGERVNILLAPLVDFGGYFWAVDLYSQDTYAESNERKIIYVRYFQGEEEFFNYMMGTIAHELQHMIFFNEKVLAGRHHSVDDIWINEGFSQLAEDITGYGYLQGVDSYRVQSFASAPHAVSLINWGGDYPDYGITYLFARFLYDSYGREVLPGVYASSQATRQALESRTGDGFQTIFQDFAKTLLLHRFGGHQRYTFADGISFDVGRRVLQPGSSWSNQNIRGWGIHFTEIGPGSGGDLTITVNAPSSNDLQMVVIERSVN